MKKGIVLLLLCALPAMFTGCTTEQFIGIMDSAIEQMNETTNKLEDALSEKVVEGLTEVENVDLDKAMDEFLSVTDQLISEYGSITDDVIDDLEGSLNQ